MDHVRRELDQELSRVSTEDRAVDQVGMWERRLRPVDAEAANRNPLPLVVGDALEVAFAISPTAAAQHVNLVPRRNQASGDAVSVLFDTCGVGRRVEVRQQCDSHMARPSRVAPVATAQKVQPVETHQL
jgi:hypothetical protein